MRHAPVLASYKPLLSFSEDITLVLVRAIIKQIADQTIPCLWVLCIMIPLKPRHRRLFPVRRPNEMSGLGDFSFEAA